jgi:hypothetical protein
MTTAAKPASCALPTRSNASTSGRARLPWLCSARPGQAGELATPIGPIPLPPGRSSIEVVFLEQIEPGRRRLRRKGRALAQPAIEVGHAPLDPRRSMPVDDQMMIDRVPGKAIIGKLEQGETEQRPALQVGDASHVVAHPCHRGAERIVLAADIQQRNGEIRVRPEKLPRPAVALRDAKPQRVDLVNGPPERRFKQERIDVPKKFDIAADVVQRVFGAQSLRGQNIHLRGGQGNEGAHRNIQRRGYFDVHDSLLPAGCLSWQRDVGRA